MTKTTLSLALLTLLSGSLDAAPKLEHTTRPVTVRMYDYAGLGAEALAEAGDLAREIYTRAGIETRWIRCRVSLDEPVYDSSCAETPGPDVLRMRIMPKTPEHIAGVNRVVFGFALTAGGKGRFGTTASVFWDRVLQAAKSPKVTRAELLAAVMAHEAGHLLLGLDSHSQEGLMAARWDTNQFTKISQGTLRFLGRQRRIVQRSAIKRLTAERRNLQP